MTNLTVKRILVVIGVIGLMAAPAAYAQISLMRVEVPFQFLAGGKVLPAGLYRVALDTATQRMELRMLDRADGIYLSARTTNRPEAWGQNQLSFHKYGNTYFLRQVVTAGRTSELPPSAAEIELAKANNVEVAFVRSSGK